MKKFLFPCVMLFALVSCNDEKKEAAVLTVLPKLVEAPAAGDTVEIAVTSTVDWTVTSADNWCTVAPASGSNNGTFKVTVAANPNKTTRETNVTVTGSGLAPVIIPVEQEERGLVTKAAMLGAWQMTEQSGGDAGAAVLGLYIVLNEDNTSLVFTDPNDPTVSTPGTWSLNGNTIALSGEMGSLSLAVSETSDPEGTWFKCSLTLNGPIQISGLPCKFEKDMPD